MITEFIIKESAKQIFKYSLEFFKKNAGKFLSKETDIYSSLNAHVQKIKNWSSEINFKDLQSSKSITNTFINLDMYVYPRVNRMEEDEKILKIPLNKIFNTSNRHYIVLGQPGAGKTTSIKHFCQSIFFNETEISKFRYPLVIKLRDCNKPITDKFSAGVILNHYIIY